MATFEVEVKITLTIAVSADNAYSANEIAAKAVGKMLRDNNNRAWGVHLTPSQNKIMILDDIVFPHTVQL